MTEGDPVPFEPGNVHENVTIVWEGEGDLLDDILSFDVPLIPGDSVPITKDALLERVSKFELVTEDGVEAEMERLSVPE